MDNWVSIYWLAPLMGWFIAHVVKFAIKFAKSGTKAVNPSILFRSGGMPSSHTAVMVAILTVIGVQDGADSAVFGLAAAVTAIVVYDALNVRRAVGEHGEALKVLSANKGVLSPKGHTPIEVVGGFAVGLIVAFALLQIL